MKKILTLCVATYNMEKYLDRCLSSVTSLEINSKLEILVINDGSKDNSLDIARKYESNRPDIVKVIDKPNGNYGSCVNKAIKNASGKYFRMLDADDWFDTKELKIYIEKLEELDADLIITNYTRHTLNGKYTITLPKKGNVKYNIIYTPQKFDVEKLSCNDLFCMHAMTYKLSVIKESGLKHLEGISYTDTEYCYYPARYMHTLCFLDINLYQYDLTRDGQTISIQSLSKSSKHIEKIALKMLSNEHNNPVQSPISTFFIHIILSFYYKSVLIDCPYIASINKDLSLFVE